PFFRRWVMATWPDRMMVRPRPVWPTVASASPAAKVRASPRRRSRSISASPRVGNICAARVSFIEGSLISAPPRRPDGLGANTKNDGRAFSVQRGSTLNAPAFAAVSKKEANQMAVRFLAISFLLLMASPARAGELVGGVFAHDVHTPFDKSGQEDGVDLH